jgi:hypothetical protein
MRTNQPKQNPGDISDDIILMDLPESTRTILNSNLDLKNEYAKLLPALENSVNKLNNDLIYNGLNEEISLVNKNNESLKEFFQKQENYMVDEQRKNACIKKFNSTVLSHVKENNNQGYMLDRQLVKAFLESNEFKALNKTGEQTIKAYLNLDKITLTEEEQQQIIQPLSEQIELLQKELKENFSKKTSNLQKFQSNNEQFSIKKQDLEEIKKIVKDQQVISIIEEKTKSKTGIIHQFQTLFTPQIYFSQEEYDQLSGELTQSLTKELNEKIIELEKQKDNLQKNVQQANRSKSHKNPRNISSNLQRNNE